MIPIRVIKKPIVIEAMQYKWHWVEVLTEWVRNNGGTIHVEREGIEFPVVKIETMEGLMRVNDGAWVLRGVRGEFYPCAADIFSETYELEEEEFDG